MNLKRVHIFQAKTIRGAPKMPTELRYCIEVRLLRRRRQIADRHVLDHAAAKRADLSHRKTSCLKGGAAKNPRSSQTGGNYCDRPLTAAPAAPFNPAPDTVCKQPLIDPNEQSAPTPDPSPPLAALVRGGEPKGRAAGGEPPRRARSAALRVRQQRGEFRQVAEQLVV